MRIMVCVTTCFMFFKSTVEKGGYTKKKIAVIIIALLFVGSIFGSEVITIVADPWLPLNGDADSDLRGYGIEIAELIFTQKGYAFEYQNLPWSRAILETRRGTYVAIIGAFEAHAPDFVFPEESITRMNNLFYVRSDSTWQYEGIESLEGQVLGVIQDYTYGDELDEYISNYRNTPAVNVFTGEDPLPRMARMLETGRITVFIEDQNTVEFTFKDSPTLKNIKQAGLAESEALYIAFSPSNPNSQLYAQILSQGIRELRESGVLQEILQKYGLTDQR